MVAIIIWDWLINLKPSPIAYNNLSIASLLPWFGKSTYRKPSNYDMILKIRLDINILGERNLESRELTVRPSYADSSFLHWFFRFLLFDLIHARQMLEDIWSIVDQKIYLGTMNYINYLKWWREESDFGKNLDCYKYLSSDG
jgi:hypothetical protein